MSVFRRSRVPSLRASLITYVGLIACASGGAYLVGAELLAIQRAEQSKSWPKVTGTLSMSTDEYRKNLFYHYTVDGVSHSSERVIYGEIGGNRDRVKNKEWERFGSLPDGSEVDVYYRPGKPSESVLVKGEVEQNTHFTILIGSVLFLMTVIAGVCMRRMGGNQCHGS